jgi:hypothetical protein
MQTAAHSLSSVVPAGLPGREPSRSTAPIGGSTPPGTPWVRAMLSRATPSRALLIGRVAEELHSSGTGAVGATRITDASQRADTRQGVNDWVLG